MKALLISAMMLLMIGTTLCSEFKVVSVKGKVYVRHNIQEEWTKVAVGDVLKPDDSMKSDARSSATILVDNAKKIVIPELVVVDIADFRTLTQEELLLKLAMEHVRTVPPQQEGDMQIPRISTLHGASKDQTEELPVHDSAIGKLELNGTRVLYTQGYFATCVLKSKEVFRLYPDLQATGDARLRVADALEKMRLRGEALHEYLNIPQAKLTDAQRSVVQESIVRLKQKKEK